MAKSLKVGILFCGLPELTFFFVGHSSFETVVIVKTDVPNGLENLRGKKLCHPGFKHDDAIPTLFLQELEKQTIALNQTFCDNQNKTILERQISSLNNFFGDSCRPGSWSQNKDFDKYLSEFLFT